jgi:hypothetical protein
VLHTPNARCYASWVPAQHDINGIHAKGAPQVAGPDHLALCLLRLRFRRLMRFFLHCKTRGAQQRAVQPTQQSPASTAVMAAADARQTLKLPPPAELQTGSLVQLGSSIAVGGAAVTCRTAGNQACPQRCSRPPVPLPCCVADACCCHAGPLLPSSEASHGQPLLADRPSAQLHVPTLARIFATVEGGKRLLQASVRGEVPWRSWVPGPGASLGARQALLPMPRSL